MLFIYAQSLNKLLMKTKKLINSIYVTDVTAVGIVITASHLKRKLCLHKIL